LKDHLSSALHGKGAERKLAAAAERRDDRALRFERPAGRLVVQMIEGTPDQLITVAPVFSGHNTLTRGRNALINWDLGSNPIPEPEPAQAGAGEHQGVETAGVELA
jgi:hypothetical protein